MLTSGCSENLQEKTSQYEGCWCLHISMCQTPMANENSNRWPKISLRERSFNTSAAAAAPLLCGHTYAACQLADSLSPPAGALFLSMGSTRKPFLSLHPNSDSLRGSMRSTSSVTIGGKKSSREAWILWRASTAFRRCHCAAEGAKYLSAPGRRQARSVARSLSFSLPPRSCFVEDKPIIGTGVNSCFGQRLKGKKAPNKDRITGLKRGHERRCLALISLKNDYG